MIIVISVMIAFLFGSFPSGYIITKKYCGIDIRTKGSGNIGSTNVKRVAGAKLAVITQLIDVMKAVIPMLLGMYISNNLSLPISKYYYLSAIAIAVVLGHDYTPFLAFKGGKGVNTTLGAFFWIATLPTLGGIAVHFILKLFTNIVSVRSIITGLTIPILCLVLKLPAPVVISTGIASLIMIIRHKDNLIRLVSNQEK